MLLFMGAPCLAMGALAHGIWWLVIGAM